MGIDEGLAGLGVTLCCVHRLRFAASPTRPRLRRRAGAGFGVNLSLRLRLAAISIRPRVRRRTGDRNHDRVKPRCILRCNMVVALSMLLLSFAVPSESSHNNRQGYKLRLRHSAVPSSPTSAESPRTDITGIGTDIGAEGSIATTKGERLVTTPQILFDSVKMQGTPPV